MLRVSLTTIVALLAGIVWVSTASAQGGYRMPPEPASPGARTAKEIPRQSSHPQHVYERQKKAARTPASGYPRFAAPLYPAPVQHVPAQMGGAMITNQAFAPHEMLYPHEYHSMYGPFYYKVKGHWLWTPFGIESHDKWELLGTTVNVKYRPSYSLFSLFVPPK